MRLCFNNIYIVELDILGFRINIFNVSYDVILEKNSEFLVRATKKLEKQSQKSCWRNETFVSQQDESSAKGLNRKGISLKPLNVGK